MGRATPTPGGWVGGWGGWGVEWVVRWADEWVGVGVLTRPPPPRTPPPPHTPPTHCSNRQLRELAATSPPAFMCHYYNHYFAHTAGGRMIGKAVSNAGEGWGFVAGRGRGWGDTCRWEGGVPPACTPTATRADPPTSPATNPPQCWTAGAASFMHGRATSRCVLKP